MWHKVLCSYKHMLFVINRLKAAKNVPFLAFQSCKKFHAWYVVMLTSHTTFLAIQRKYHFAPRQIYMERSNEYKIGLSFITVFIFQIGDTLDVRSRVG